MTAEEYIIKKLEEQELLNSDLTLQNFEQQQRIRHLESIVDTLKKHASLENGTLCIFITESKKEDRDFIVEALKLKEEEKPNE